MHFAGIVNALLWLVGKKIMLVVLTMLLLLPPPLMLIIIELIVITVQKICNIETSTLTISIAKRCFDLVKKFM